MEKVKVTNAMMTECELPSYDHAFVNVMTPNEMMTEH